MTQEEGAQKLKRITAMELTCNVFCIRREKEEGEENLIVPVTLVLAVKMVAPLRESVLASTKYTSSDPYTATIHH